MAFGNLMNDSVTLEKQTGEVYDNIEANVQPEKIFIDDETLPIEEGDILTRELPNGLVERYRVLDRGFYDVDMGSLGPHYQVSVRKESSIEASEQEPRQIIYNLHGANPRVNVESYDASVNIVNVDSGDLFAELRARIEVQVDEPEQRQQLLEKIEEMEKAEGTEDFSDRYQDFIASAADHMAVIAPFIPALTQLLSS